MLVTVLIGAGMIAVALATWQPQEPGRATNPLIPLVVFNWIYRAGVLVTAAGWMLWVVRLFRAARRPVTGAPVQPGRT